MAFAVISMFLCLTVTNADAAAGAAGDIDAPDNVVLDLAFYINLKDLTDGADYVVYPDTTTYGASNHTFTASGTTHRYRAILTSAGTTLYSVGGDAGSGNAASAIASTSVASAGLLDSLLNVAFFTNLIPFFVGIGIAVVLVTIFIKKFIKNKD